MERPVPQIEPKAEKPPFSVGDTVKTSATLIVLIITLAFVIGIASCVKANLVVDEWPTLQHDPIHTGYSTGIAPNTNQTLWCFKTGGGVGSPIVSDDKVYVTSDDGKIYCLDALSGIEVWSFYIDCGARLVAPAINGTYIYVCSHDGNLYCLNAENGAMIWSFSTGDWVQSSLAIAYGNMYVGSNDGYLYAFGSTEPLTTTSPLVTAPQNQTPLEPLKNWVIKMLRLLRKHFRHNTNSCCRFCDFKNLSRRVFELDWFHLFL